MNHFAVNPQINISRSRFDLDSTVKFTGNSGDLIPFYVMEVLPGDTFEVKTSMVARLQTLIHPIMDNLYMDTYYFFVPNRLVWDHWQQFCGEPNKAWTPDVEYEVPQIAIYLNSPRYQTDGEYDFNKFAGYFKDTVIDYMGLGLNSGLEPEVGIDSYYKFNALPVRAYNKIYDDWFRDENLIDPINLYTGDAMVYFSDESPVNGGKCYKAAKIHDYFTSALPQAQRGNPVELAFGDNIVKGVKTFSSDFTDLGNTSLKVKVGTSTTPSIVRSNSDNLLNTGGSSGGSGVLPTNLGLDLSNLSLGITINDLRLAFQVQKFMEKSARGGARYIELLKEMFGVTSPDSRLQRSEYLGGHRIPINIHQIVNQTETIDAPLGNTGAMSLTSDVHNDFIHSFVEHGFVIGICVVRYKHSYSQGFNRFWSRKTKFDYYWPVFANIGEQPIRNKEIYATRDEGEDVFGYQEAWADYRYVPDRVAGEMRPGIPNTLASWHLGDYYDTTPYLAKDWIEESLAPVDRAIAVTSAVSDQFLFDFYIQNRATRPMPVYSIPGLADHL